MAVSKFMARQYGRPSGTFGRLITAPLLNRANEQSNQRVFQMLQVEDDQTVLEIGFGGGQLLSMMMQDGTSAQLHGVEVSAAMIKRARRQFGKDKRNRPPTLESGRADAIPYPADHFDRVCSVNTVYFWADLVSSVTEIARVTNPEGVVVLGFGSAASLRAAGYEAQGFILYTPDDVISALTSNGFELDQHQIIEREERGDFHVLRCIRR